MPLECPASGGATSPTSSLTYHSLSVGDAELLNKVTDRPELAATGSEEEESDPGLVQKKVHFPPTPTNQRNPQMAEPQRVCRPESYLHPGKAVGSQMGGALGSS